MNKLRGFARNVEVWIFGALGGLVLAACLDKPGQHPLPASRVSAVPETEPAQPRAGTAEPMYVVYVVGKRPTAAEKRAARRAGAG